MPPRTTERADSWSSSHQSFCAPAAAKTARARSRGRGAALRPGAAQRGADRDDRADCGDRGRGSAASRSGSMTAAADEDAIRHRSTAAAASWWRFSPRCSAWAAARRRPCSCARRTCWRRCAPSMLLGAVLPELRCETEALAADLGEMVRLRGAAAAERDRPRKEVGALGRGPAAARRPGRRAPARARRRRRKTRRGARAARPSSPARRKLSRI